MLLCYAMANDVTWCLRRPIQKYTGSNDQKKDSSIYLQGVSFSFGRQTGPEPLERPGSGRHIRQNHEEEEPAEASVTDEQEAGGAHRIESR